MFIPIGDDVNKRSFPVVGILLLMANVLVFLYMHRLWNEWQPSPYSDLRASFYSSDYWKFIMKWGAVPKHVEQGRVEGLFTHMFMHGDFWHIFGNMLVFWGFVMTLEVALGPGRFLVFYILWGLLAGLAEVFMQWHSDRPGIGASGAIAGMMGAYFVVFGALTRIKTMIWFIVPLKIIYMPAGVFAFIWILTQMHGLDTAQKYGQSNVGWYAHLGGFVAGVATMFLLRSEIKSRMYRDSYGVWQLKDVEEAPARAVPEGDDADAPMDASTAAAPVGCSGCGAAITEEHKIHEKLFRCPSCKKLTYKM